MARRKGGDSYLGGSTVIGPGGSWPQGTEIQTKIDPAGKRFSTSRSTDKSESARLEEVEAARRTTAVKMAARKKTARRQAQWENVRAKTAAKAAAAASVTAVVTKELKARTARILKNIEIGVRKRRSKRKEQAGAKPPNATTDHRNKSNLSISSKDLGATQIAEAAEKLARARYRKTADVMRGKVEVVTKRGGKTIAVRRGLPSADKLATNSGDADQGDISPFQPARDGADCT